MSQLNLYSLQVLFSDQLSTNPDRVVYVVDLSTKTEVKIIPFFHLVSEFDNLVEIFNNFSIVKHNGTAPYLVPKLGGNNV